MQRASGEAPESGRLPCRVALIGRGRPAHTLRRVARLYNNPDPSARALWLSFPNPNRGLTFRPNPPRGTLGHSDRPSRRTGATSGNLPSARISHEVPQEEDSLGVTAEVARPPFPRRGADPL